MSCNCGCGPGSCSCQSGGHSGCGCGGHKGFERRFATKEERVKDLECYLDALKKETQAVQEKIDDLKKK